jgi:hypothetical protein
MSPSRDAQCVSESSNNDGRETNLGWVLPAEQLIRRKAINFVASCLNISEFQVQVAAAMEPNQSS